MIRDLIEDEYCKWCGRALEESFLTRISPSVTRGEWKLTPVLCICGGVTVLGACAFVSAFDKIGRETENGE